MLTVSVRLLRLLGVLQSQREWAGRDLSERLEVDVRTLRRDIDRLRDLGYVISSASGPGGGYRLGAGSNTPPLLLDDDEAVAVAVALAAAAGSVSDPEDVALRVLAKLDRVMPPRLRRKLGVIKDATSLLPGARVTVDFRVLATLATACLDQLELRFSYQDARGNGTSRAVEPLRLVHTGRLWYLAARDVDRDDLRTFRVDRIRSVELPKNARRFVSTLSPQALTAFVAEAISTSPYRYQAKLRLEGRVSSLRPRIPSWLGVLERESETHSVLVLGAESQEVLVALMGHLDLDFQLLEPLELGESLERAAQRLMRGARAKGPSHSMRH